mgnify:CR=1 FL=1
MSIPDFDQFGNLPPGIYFCAWEEFIDRFETTPQRSRLIQGLTQAMLILKTAGCRTIYINGSFVTNKAKPNDFDACWDVDGVDIDYLKTNAPKLLNCIDQKAKYKGELFPSEWVVDELGTQAIELFQVDKKQNRKGIIAIDLIRWEK